MNLFIIEDLDRDCKRLSALIREDCAKNDMTVTIKEFQNEEDFWKYYIPGTCDGIFLDILLGSSSGIDIARKIREMDPDLPIIFTTTEPDFALEGFSVHAMDYLVKPIDAENTAWCLKKLREYTKSPAALTIMETCGWGHSRTLKIPLNHILYAQYYRHSVNIHTVQGVFSTRISFRDFTQKLPHNGQFIVCARGLLVNLARVEKTGDGEILLKNGETILFSRSRKNMVQKAFTEWVFTCSRKGGHP